MSRSIGILIVAVVAVAAVTLVFLRREDARRSRFVEAAEHGSKLETNQRYAEAILAYEAALDLDLEDAERAEIRYRLARSQIRGNDLNGALGSLRELTAEDVARFEIDVGPLYLELGQKARDAGRKDLARIVLQEGAGASPDRYEDFARPLEDMAIEVQKEREKDKEQEKR